MCLFYGWQIKLFVFNVSLCHFCYFMNLSHYFIFYVFGLISWEFVKLAGVILHGLLPLIFQIHGSECIYHFQKTIFCDFILLLFWQAVFVFCFLVSTLFFYFLNCAVSVNYWNWYSYSPFQTLWTVPHNDSSKRMDTKQLLLLPESFCYILICRIIKTQ